MKVCIPISKDIGEESIPFNHFGSAPYFLIYDVEKNETKAIKNEDLHHSHGMCQPLRAIGGEKVDAILVAGIGAGALSKLANEGVKVYKSVEGTVKENVNLLKEHKLMEFSIDNSCKHHDCNH